MSSRIPVYFTLAVITLLAACSPSVEASTEVTRETLGDTTFVSIAAEHEAASIQVDSVEIIWKSDALARPNSMIRAGNTLVIGDSPHLHMLTDGGSYLRSVGRAGEGPKEFGMVSALGSTGDSVIILDDRNIRQAIVTLDGDFVSTHRLAWPEDFVSTLREPDELRFHDGGVLRFASQLIRIDEPTRLALIWESLTTDSSAVLREWDDGVWFEVGGVIAYRTTFPARAVVAVGPNGRFAHGDGLEYCFILEELDRSAVTRVCRHRGRQGVGSGVRGVAVTDFPNLNERQIEFRDVLESIFREQKVNEYHPSFTRLTFGTDGKLWVRTTGPQIPDIHPVILSRMPDQQPLHHRWEAYAPDGSPLGGVFLPRLFTPHVFGDAEAWGFFELDTGEIVVARVAW